MGGSCSTNDSVVELNPKMATHPCYSKQAHQYARIHLPVAPACNIQCNYCNRKFDCSNESRPGVVSKLLAPAQAAERYRKVKARIPETKVVGIAGPGDPLANPASTLATLKAVAKLEDDIHLCVSTNGLNLVDHAKALREVGVEHLTITINCIDADIGAQIYPWIYFDHRRLRGRQGAQTLIDRQLAGLKAAAEQGMLVKINTVLIPGINDHHVAAVASEVKRLGAALHNVMPLIAEAEHGTYFGLMGQRSPTEEELAKAREEAGVSMAQMSHCQQCRADAVGRLGQDCSDIDQDAEPAADLGHGRSSGLESERDPERRLVVAVASRHGQFIDQHFGHATRFHLYQLTEQGISDMPDREVSQYCSGEDTCTDDESSPVADAIAALKGVDMLLCSRLGIGPWQALEAEGVAPSTDFTGMTIKDALQGVQAKWVASLANSADYADDKIGEVI
ncbi:nitrogenase cofactor biosynthesis protein NifB [Corallincola platygyrae]|uniref:FeMo cofactor biosynthesis protein NifB n=1 Tax=Corallincola platygyrae TaxID=1193278 RepID=A0ABW4XHK9_9GAMM